MFQSLVKKLLVGAVLLGVAFFCFNLSAKKVQSEEDLSVICQWENIEPSEKTLSAADFRALLEKCKVYYDKKTVEIGKDIDKTAQEKKTLNNKIAELKSKVTKLQYEINQGNIMIKDLSGQIDDTQVSIVKTSDKIDGLKAELSTMVQLRYEEDQKSALEIFLANQTISAFFDDLVGAEMINNKTQDLLRNIKGLKTDLEAQKASMDDEKKQMEDLVIIQNMQKKDSAAKKAEQEKFLKLTEQEYQKYLQEKKIAQEQATKIGNKLFALLEVPDGGIQFEQAVEIAKSVGNQVGVRPAFSLAILWQETRIGKLKGGCYLQNEKNGDGIYIKSGNKAPKTMHPTRDAPIFLNLVASLNTAGFLKTGSYNTPVSCCMIQNGSYFGWGGAMGPAQFIPSTWNIYKDQIEKIAGNSPANPWNIRHAFLANSIYLKDLGAGAQTATKEISAALKYFGCSTSWCKAQYGTPVMKAATCFQSYIDTGQMSDSCSDYVFGS